MVHFSGNKKLVLSVAINVMLAFALSMLIYLVYHQFIYELDSVSKWTRYSVRTYRKYEGGMAFFEVLMGPKEDRQPQVPRRIYSYSGKQAFHVEMMGPDMTGNGVPDLVISQWNGSAHGDSRYLVLELSGSVVNEIDVVDGLLSATFEDLNNDGTLEIAAVDRSYSYFLDSYAASPRPSVVLSFDKTLAKFVPDKKLMLKPPLSQDQLDKLTLKYKNDPRWSKEFRPPSELFDTMLGLIYSGNEKQAWELFDASWSDVSKIPKQECKEALEENLSESPFYPVIADWNKGKS